MSVFRASGTDFHSRLRPLLWDWARCCLCAEDQVGVVQERTHMQLHVARVALDDDRKACVPLHRLSYLRCGFSPTTPVPSADTLTAHHSEESL